MPGATRQRQALDRTTRRRERPARTLGRARNLPALPAVRGESRRTSTPG